MCWVRSDPSIETLVGAAHQAHARRVISRFILRCDPAQSECSPMRQMRPGTKISFDSLAILEQRSRDDDLVQVSRVTVTDNCHSLRLHQSVMRGGALPCPRRMMLLRARPANLTLITLPT